MGPFATQILGDMGADVMKVESVEGDLVRAIGPLAQPRHGRHLPAEQPQQAQHRARPEAARRARRRAQAGRNTPTSSSTT